MVVHKYPLFSSAWCGLDMPAGAQILHVGEQDGLLFLWALIDPDAPIRSRTFHAINTGQHFTGEGTEYIGTVSVAGGAMPIVWHVFEQVEALKRTAVA